MSYTVINNLLSENNHSSHIADLFKTSTSVIIASPFLMHDFSDFFNNSNLSTLKNLHLITILPPNDSEQFKKIASLVSLINYPSFKSGNIPYKVSINNKLHGKVYIFKKIDGSATAIISSANFTKSGLDKKHEWGVEITDMEAIISLEESIISTIDKNITEHDIREMKKTLDAIPQSKRPKTEKVKLDLMGTLLHTPLNIAPSATFWIKPYGENDSRVTSDMTFSDDSNAFFSKIRPIGVKPKDILIVYGVGPRKILAVYEVLSKYLTLSQEEQKTDKNHERWPHYVKVKNLTPLYGANWNRYNFQLLNLRNEFLIINPDLNVTTKGQTLGGLSRGKDKMRLSSAFAKFVINKIITAENNYKKV